MGDCKEKTLTTSAWMQKCVNTKMQIVQIKPQKFWQESAKVGGPEKESLISLKHFRIMVGPFKASFEKTEQWTAADELVSNNWI